jgi:branched-chain amino acid transport system ATP-binding protein
MICLEIKDVSVNFGGVKALSNVSFNVDYRSISALIGPNGAGKTTLFNVITNFVVNNSGKILFKGECITGLKPHQIHLKGISRTFQNLNLIKELTLKENLYLGIIGKKKPSAFRSMLRLNTEFWKNIDEKITDILRFTNILEWQDYYPDSAPYGVLKNLEMARALLSEPDLLLLDEPAAGLNNKERDRLSDMIKKISDKKITVLMVEHDMNFIANLADKVVCLNFGKVIADGTFKEIRENPEVLKAYLGEDDA